MRQFKPQFKQCLLHTQICSHLTVSVRIRVLILLVSSCLPLDNASLNNTKSPSPSSPAQFYMPCSYFRIKTEPNILLVLLLIFEIYRNKI